MKPRVLFILHLPPPVHGAATMGKYIRESNLINKEIIADFINLATNDVLQESGKGGLKKIGRLLNIQIQILKALITKQYDRCYMTLTASGPGFYKDLFIVLLLKVFNQKIIYHFHNKGIANNQDKGINNYLYRFALNNTQCILLSQFLYPDVAHYIKPSDIFYVPNGIPPYPPSLIQKRVLKEHNTQPCRLLFLSNMQEEKGVLVLLEACKILKEKGLAFECHFVGAWSDVSEPAFKTKVIENDLTGFVFAHGPQYNHDKIAFLNNADIFLFPTYYKYETFGLVNLEAMQFSLPIISTPEGGIPEVVVDRETGFLVPKRNVPELVEKLEILIQNPALRLQMGRAGAKRYTALFTLEKFENNFVNVLQSAIKEKKNY